MAFLCLSACTVQKKAKENAEVEFNISPSVSVETEGIGVKRDLTERKENEQSNKLPIEIQDNCYISDCFTVIKKTYEQNGNGFDLEIFYPELQGMDNAEKEERINQLIESEAQRLIPKENDIPDEWVEDGYIICVFLDYEIKFLNNNVISILYTGMDGCIVKGLDGAIMTTIIDLQAEKVIKLSDIITDMKQLHSLLLEDQFQNITFWEGIASSDSISEVYKEEREGWLMDALNGTSQEHSFIEWYTDGRNLIIVSTSPYGKEDYNEYAASLESIQEVVSQEFVKRLYDETLY